VGATISQQGWAQHGRAIHMNERVAQQAHQGGALIGAKQFGQVNGGGIKTEK